MMKDSEQTIGNLVDKSSTAFISYVDNEGFPVTKAMLKPRERQGIKVFLFSTNTSSNFSAKTQKQVYILWIGVSFEESV